MRVAAATRVASVAVGVGEEVTVAVAVGEGIRVAVEEGATVKVTVVETAVLGRLLSFLEVVMLPSSRYAKIALMEAIKLNIPIMPNHFLTLNLML